MVHYAENAQLLITYEIYSLYSLSIRPQKNAYLQAKDTNKDL